jgi:serine phosphatase RsbU (regulator of sigma subunit)
MPVGVYLKEFPFTNHVIDLQTDDTLYLFSDGYIDQFNGTTGDKYKLKRFKNTLLDISKHPMQKQKELLTEEFDAWRGNIKQLDDILVVGVKIQDDYGDIDFF